MKKLLFVIIAITLCLSVFSGCKQNTQGTEKFEFALAVEKNKYELGELIRVTATVTNVSGKTYRYVGCSGNDFIPSIALYSNGSEDGEEHHLTHEPLVFPTDVVDKKVKNGKSGACDYAFLIPKDATLGNYNITLSYGGEQKEFTDVLQIVERIPPAETYRYTSTIVSSGIENIKPIQTLGSKSEFAANGEELLHADGEGSYGIFSDPETNPSDFPTLVASEKVTVTPSRYSKIGSPSVYDLNYEHVKGAGWDGLHQLPAGEYIVVFTESTDSRNTQKISKTYWLTGYENIFRLIVLGE